MSQSGMLRIRAGILPPAVPLQFTGNTGTSIPVLNNENIKTSNSTIIFTGSGDTLTLDFLPTNIAIGSTLPNEGVGNFNVFIGEDVGDAFTDGQSNVGMGSFALLKLQDGNGNVAYGTRSLGEVVSSNGNTAVGNNALENLLSGESNVSIGINSLIQLQFGDENIAIGSDPLFFLGSGSNNIALGSDVGINYTGAESSNIIIGNSGLLGESNSIRIGTQGIGIGQQTRVFLAGIVGTTVTGNLVNVSATGQLGETSISSLLSFDVQANTAPGTDPVIPTAGGIVIINGAAVANHSVVLETHSRAANAFNLEIQYATTAAATDATKSGVAHFNSAIFTVDANGFVSTSGGSLVQSITGGPGITITGTAAVPIVNSVIFTDTTAATLAVDNGYFATAAGTYPLPATAAQGEILIVVCDTAGAVVLDAPALNFIRVGSAITTAGGTATSNAIGNSLTLRYRLSSLTWEATSVIGTWTLA